MQSLGYDLIVDDDGIIQEAGKIVEKTEDFEQKLGELSDILSNVLDDAIMQGNTAENLMLFADEVQGLRSNRGILSGSGGQRQTFILWTFHAG